MGGSKATSVVKTSVAAKTLARSILDCSNMTQVKQSVEIRGDNNVFRGVKMSQRINLSNKCDNNNDVLNKTKTDLASALKQSAETSSSALLGALNAQGSTLNSRIDNEVEQIISNDTITKIMSDVNLSQKLIVEGSNNLLVNIELEQVSDLVADACQKVINQSTLLSAITNQADQKAVSVQTNPIAEIVDSIFSGLSTQMIIMAFVLCVAIAAGVFFIYKGGLNVLLGGMNNMPGAGTTNTKKIIRIVR